MKILVKQLRGSECSLEVEPETTIHEITKQLEEKLHISADCQRLLYLGKTLAEENTVSSYPTIKDGAKLHLTVKKSEGLYDVSLKYFKQMGLSDAEAAKGASRFLNVVSEKLDQLSWDDIDKLTMDFMLVNEGKRPMSIEREVNCMED